MLKYGTDKPDLRNPLIIYDITNIFSRDDVRKSKTSLFVFFKSLKEIVGILCMIHYTDF